MSSAMQILAWAPGPMELVVIAMFGLLIFGRRLPEVGKSLGKSIVEFKKGLRDVEQEIERADDREMLPPPSANNTVSRNSEQQVASNTQAD